MQIPAVQAIEADVLVVGAGLAGCWAALGAKEYVGRVVLVDKAVVGKSGASTFASGVMLAPLPEDDLDDWLKEIVENGEYMSDQYWVMALLNEQMSRIAQMESWGFAFERDADGRLARTVGRGHRKTKVLMFHGPKLMVGMRKKVLAKNIRLIERVMVTDLIAGDDVDDRRVDRLFVGVGETVLVDAGAGVEDGEKAHHRDQQKERDDDHLDQREAADGAGGAEGFSRHAQFTLLTGSGLRRKPETRAVLHPIPRPVLIELEVTVTSIRLKS